MASFLRLSKTQLLSRPLSTSPPTLNNQKWSSLLYRDDPDLHEKKVAKSNEHFLKVKTDFDNREIDADEANFYNKVRVASKSTGYKSYKMQKKIATIEKYYLTKKRYEEAEIIQQVKEYDIGVRHLVNSLGLADKQQAKQFLELNSWSEEAERSVIDYYFPSPLKEKSTHELKNPKMKMSKFQLEQILSESSQNENNNLFTGESSNKSITEANKMTQVKYYTDPTMLSSKDLLYKISKKIDDLDKQLAKYQKERFTSRIISEEFHQLLDDGIQFRTYLRSHDWKRPTEFETLEIIDTLSKFSYRQICEELERLIDHPIYYKEIEFILKFSLASDAAIVKKQNSSTAVAFNVTSGQALDRKSESLEKVASYNIKSEIFEKYHLKDGRVLENVKIHFGTGLEDGRQVSVAEVKLIEIDQSEENGRADVFDSLTVINGYSLKQFFPHVFDRLEIFAPLNLLNKMGKYHIEIYTYGGDMNDDHLHGHHMNRGTDRHRDKDSGAIRNAISRILYSIGTDEDKILLENASILEYDDREKERPRLGNGTGKARKNRQWRRR